MIWQFQVTNRTVLQRLRAMQTAKGTYFYRIRRILLWICSALMAVSFFFSLILPVIQGEIQLDAFLVFPILFCFLLLSSIMWGMSTFFLPFHFLFQFHVSRQIRCMLGNVRITVRNGLYIHEGDTGANGAGNFIVPFSEIRQILPKRKGILILFVNEESDFLPAAAFGQYSREQSLSFLRKAMQESREQEQQNRASGPDSSTISSWDTSGAVPLSVQTPEQPSGGTLYFDVPISHVGPLYAQCWRALCWCPRYWQLQKKSLLLLTAALLLGIQISVNVGNHVLLLIVLLIFLLIPLFCFFYYRRYLSLGRKGRMTLYCGPQSIALTEQELILTRPATVTALPYSLFDSLQETEDAFYLIQKKPLGFLPIPKWAFTSEQELLLFTARLQQKISE